MPRVPMNILFDDIEVIESVGDPSSVEVRGISHDSRRVAPGDLFCCVPGRVSTDPAALRLSPDDQSLERAQLGRVNTNP